MAVLSDKNHSKANNTNYMIKFINKIKQSVVKLIKENSGNQVRLGVLVQIDLSPPIYCLLTDCTLLVQNTAEYVIIVQYSTEKGRFQRKITQNDCGPFQKKITNEILKGKLSTIFQNITLFQLSREAVRDFIQNDANFMSISEPIPKSEIIFFEIIDDDDDFLAMSPVVQVNIVNEHEFEINSAIHSNAQTGVFIDLIFKTLVGFFFPKEKSQLEFSIKRALNLFQITNMIQMVVDTSTNKTGDSEYIVFSGIVFTSKSLNSMRFYLFKNINQTSRELMLSATCAI